MARLLKKKSGLRIFEYAFLDVTRPSIPEGIEACVRKGATEIVVLQNFLNSGNHVLKDIPAMIRQAKKKFPGVCFVVTRPIGRHPKIGDLFNEYLM